MIMATLSKVNLIANNDMCLQKNSFSDDEFRNDDRYGTHRYVGNVAPD